MQRGDLIGGRFEIVEYVASGGMGRVFRARDTQSGERVAVKVLLGNFVEQGLRFDREGKALATLSHPGIVRYVAHGLAASGEAYLAMEWLEGEDLASRLARGKLSLEDGIQLAIRVAEAVHAVHAYGIVHRDLKPSNIFLVDGRIDQVKVLDFGIARLASGTRLTRTGMLIGTPGYMAPEQAATDLPIDARADVFALGCVLFECLTGVFTFAAEHLMALLAKVMFAEPQRLRDVLPDAPAALDELIGRMLAKDPAARPAHCGAVVEALAALGAHAEGGAAAPPAAALTLDEQRMFSVILIGGEAGQESTGASAPEANRPIRIARTLQEGAAVWGGRIELLSDGSMAVAIGGGSLVTDQATQAARCALWLRTRVGGRPMALAIGRGDRSGRLPAAETIDRAVEMLLARSPVTVGAGDVAGDGISIDEVTARLLDARFDVRARGRGAVLHGEHELTEGPRVLLGRPTPCVGRDLELRTLAQLFEECTEELAARAAIVTAPPGIGKSRLAQEFLRTLKTRTAPGSVWLCRGESHRAGSAFNLLSQLVRSACGILDGEPLDVQRQKLVARVARLAHAEPVQRIGNAEDHARLMSHFLGELAGTPFPDDDNLPLRMARKDALLMNEQLRAAFLDFLRAETAAGAVVVVLEDLHWGDLSTVQVLDAALRDLCERPLFVLALARPEVHELFPRLWDERAIQELPLKQLGKKASELLVRHVLGEGAGRELVDRLVRLSEGNAFYLEELIRAAAEGQVGDFPETVVAMVQSRLDALDDDARRILRAASVFGEVFWSGAVARLLGTAELAAGTAQRLRALADRELITRRSQRRFSDEEEYSFRHALLREGAYTTLTDEDRALGHRLAGEWLEQRGEQDPLLLAEHFDRGGDGARAGMHYLHAANLASLGGDVTAVIARAKRALGYDMPDELRTHCLGMLCVLLYFHMNFQADTLSYAEEVLRVAPRGTRPWFQGMLFKIAYSHQVGPLDELVTLLGIAADTSPVPGAAPIWASCIGTGSLLLDLLGRSREADRLLDELEVAVRAVDEQEPLALAVFNLILTLRLAYSAEDPMKGLERGEWLLRVSEAMEYRRNVELAKTCVGMNRWCLGALAGTDRMIIGVTMSDSDFGIVSSLRPFVLAWLFADQGNLDEARRWATQLVEASRTRPVPLDEGRGQWALAEVLRRAGELDGADAAIQAALALLRVASPLDTPGALATLAAVRLAQGRIAEALAATEEGLAKYEAMGTCGFFRGAFLRLVHAESREATGDHEAAKAAIAAARARLLAIAAKIGDPEYRKSFLEGVPENRRTLELARQWAGPDEA